MAELQEALKLAPNDAGVQRDLADLYIDAKKYDLAEAQFRSLLVTRPNDGELHYGLGRTLLKQKKFPEAEKELMAAIQLKPDLGAAYGELAGAANETRITNRSSGCLDTGTNPPRTSPIEYFLRPRLMIICASTNPRADYIASLKSYRAFILIRSFTAPSSPDRDRA